MNYLTQKEEGETFTSAEQRVRLNWSTALSNVDLLNLYAQFSEREDTNPDARETRPLAGFILSGPEYSWLVEYREFKSENLEEDLTLKTDTLFTTFSLTPGDDFPDLTIDYSRTSSKDNLNPHETDFVQTDFGVRASYERGPLSLRYSHRISEFDNKLTTLSAIKLQIPTGIAVDPSGIIFVTDSAANEVMRFTTSGAFLGEFGGFGTGQGQFRNPKGIDIGQGFIYVVDTDNNRIERFDSTGRFLSEWGTLGIGPGQFDNPYGVAVDSTGVYVSDQQNNRVQKFTLDGTFLFTFSGTFNLPSGIASNGTLVFVADTQNQRIQAFTTAGTFVTQWGSFGTGPGQFQSPVDVAVDSSNRVYVTDRDNNRIQVFTTSGAFLSSFGAPGSGPGQFNAPTGIAVTVSDEIVVADTGNSRLELLTNTGTFRLEIGSAISTQKAQSTILTLDTFNVTYGKELFQGVYASLDYDFFRSVEEDKDSGHKLVSTTNHDITSQLRFQPYRWVTLGSLFDLRLYDTTAGDQTTDRQELTQSYTMSLQPIQKMNLSASYTRDTLDTNVGPDENNTFTTVSLNMIPTRRINLNFSFSNEVDEQNGEKVLETDNFTATSDMIVYRGVSANMLFSTSTSTDFVADSEVDSSRIRGGLRLAPRPNMTLNTISEYNTSDTRTAGLPDVTTDTVLSSLNFTWAISRHLDFFVDADYINTTSEDVTTSTLSYISNLIYRMNEHLIFFAGYRGTTQPDDNVFSFRTQLKYPFFWHSDLSVNYEIDVGQSTSSTFLYMELMKVF